MSFSKKDPCRHPGLCPWKTQPVVGTWARVDGIEFWGTNCLLYTKCPDPRWRANHATDGPDDREENDMKTKTSDLKDQALDWVVAGLVRPINTHPSFSSREWHTNINRFLAAWDNGNYNYSSNWALAGPIIEREKIELHRIPKDGVIQWCANGSDFGCMEYGPTPLVAAMRCYVASKLGDEVDVPEELA